MHGAVPDGCETTEVGLKLVLRAVCRRQTVATFEPSVGGNYFSAVWAPKTIWAKTTEALTAATAWPFQQNRTPATVLVTTLLMMILVASITGRRGWRWDPNASILRALARMATLAHRMGEGLGVRASGAISADRKHPVRFSKLETQNAKLETALSPRERRWFTQPIWRQALSVFMIVALVFTTTPTEVQAATPLQSFTTTTAITWARRTS